MHVQSEKVLELNYEKTLCEELVAINREIKELQERQKLLQDELKDMRPQGGKAYGISMAERTRKGSVDMEWLCLSEGISEEKLNNFRKPETKYWVISNY